MRVVVFGASGQTGQVLVRQALERQHAVTAFVRTPSKSPSAGLTRVVVGDVADSRAVAAAVSGQDAVVSTLGVGTPLKSDPNVTLGVQHIVRAMEEQGIRRLIYMSFVGVRDSRAAVGFLLRYVAPIPLRHEIADHESKEALIRASSLDWTIVRPPTLTNGPKTGRFRDGESISTWVPMPMLSRADVAGFMLDELADSKYIRRAPRLLR